MSILFGILAILAGFVGAWMAGWFGVGFTVILGALAIVFTVLKNKKLPEEEPRKKAGIVTGIIGIVLVFLMQLAVISVGNTMMEKDEKEFPILRECGESFKVSGFIGMANHIQEKGYTMDELQKEVDKWNAEISNK
ncbi:MAG: hypothetical protein IJM27_12900 [Eubacterium sp.]|nr:hypothetical protein [Eubacterium sp.]